MLSLSKDLEKLVIYSATSQTWAKHCSAWKLFNSFCCEFSIANKLPIPVEYIRAFATWALTKKGLKSSTVRSYVSSLNTAHALSNNKNTNFCSDTCIKMALKGADNFNALHREPRIVRLPMNIHLLDILGDRISVLDWNAFSKQVLWTACTVCFFTSCRMGELLPCFEKNFDPMTTLLWGNVKFLSESEVIILIPYCKTKGFEGKLIDLYPLTGDSKCPVAAISLLKKMASKLGFGKNEDPVFAFKQGKYLTKEYLNRILMNLIGDFCDCNHSITGHSFRAAIPSLLASHPDQHSIAELKEWGSWQSDSYKLYTKSERDKRRVLFGKIVKCMYM